MPIEANNFDQGGIQEYVSLVNSSDTDIEVQKNSIVGLYLPESELSINNVESQIESQTKKITSQELVEFITSIVTRELGPASYYGSNFSLLDNFRTIKSAKNINISDANENEMQKLNTELPSKVKMKDMKNDITEAKEMGWWDFFKDKVQKTLLPNDKPSPQGDLQDHPQTHEQGTVAHVQDDLQSTEDEKKAELISSFLKNGG